MSRYRIPIGLIALLCSVCAIMSAAPASADPSSVQLMLEYQDGARLIGKSPDSSLKFQSDVFGSFPIRSLGYVLPGQW
jgi:hypothetical protein